MRRTLLLVAMALIVFGAIRFSLARDDSPPLLGQKAPNFSLKTVDGKTVTLADQKGKVVVLDFWATWCAPCLAGLPHTQEMSTKPEWASKGLVVWAVNSEEDADTIKKFLSQNHQYTFTVPMDSDGAVEKNYQLPGVPVVIVIGRDQVVKDVILGYSPEIATAIDNSVQKTLDESPKS
jgi:peroxiredoxin